MAEVRREVPCLFCLSDRSAIVERVVPRNVLLLSQTFNYKMPNDRLTSKNHRASAITEPHGTPHPAAGGKSRLGAEIRRSSQVRGFLAAAPPLLLRRHRLCRHRRCSRSRRRSSSPLPVELRHGMQGAQTCEQERGFLGNGLVGRGEPLRRRVACARQDEGPSECRRGGSSCPLMPEGALSFSLIISSLALSSRYFCWY